MMTPNEYQEKAMRTKASPAIILQRLNDYGPSYLQAWIGLNGLVNETGELSEIIKASIEYGKGPIDKVHVKEEVGDCLWRLSQICNALGITLEECMEGNISKLSKRYPEKYTDEQALNRDLKEERTVLEGPIKRGGSEELTGIDWKSVSVNPSGFAEPPEKEEKTIPKIGDPSPSRETYQVWEGFKFGQPDEPGDYEWFHKNEDPVNRVIFRNYNGNTAHWGRDTYYKKIN